MKFFGFLDEIFLDFLTFFLFLNNFFRFLTKGGPKGPKDSFGKRGPKGLGLEVGPRIGPILLYCIMLNLLTIY